MSHFTVLVIGENPEKQLFPFNEDVDSLPKEYVKFQEEDIEKEYEDDTVEVIKLSDGSLSLTWDDKFLSPKYDFMTSKDEDKFIYPDDSTKVKASFKEIYSTIEKFAKDWHGMEDRDPATGKYGYWTNPNGKWDWYELGGRWKNMLKLKTYHSSDSAMIKDIDFERMERDSQKKCEETWDSYVKLEESEKNFTAYMNGISKEDTKESYIENNKKFSTFAVIKDGKWYEKGEMGWWACVSNEKESSNWGKEFDSLLKSLPEETLLSVYDCHV